MEPYTEFKNIFDTLRAEVASHIVGNDMLVDLVVLSVLTGLSTAAEGESGIGKTKTAEVALKASGLTKATITLGGDNLPSDLTGNLYYDLATGSYKVRQGPFVRFTGIVLDELNRTTDRIWNTLLDILNSRRVVIDGVEHPLDELTVILATLNPIESEGTRPLPRALRDRLDNSVWVPEPSEYEEAEIARRAMTGAPVMQALDLDALKSARYVYGQALKLNQTNQGALAEAARISAAFKDRDIWEVRTSPRTVISMVNTAVALSLAYHGEVKPGVWTVQMAALNCIRHTVEPKRFTTTAEKEQLIIETLLAAGVPEAYVSPA